MRIGIGTGPAATLLGAIALTAIGCGGGGEGATTAQTTAAPTQTATTTATTSTSAAAGQPVTVGMTEFKLDPATPRVKRGEVKFKAVNNGGTVHALEIEGPTGEVETRRLQPGESQTLSAKLDEPGRYTMYCPVGNHRDQGMKGEVIVE